MAATSTTCYRKTRQQLASVVFLFFVFMSSSLSSARLLNDNILSHGLELEATEVTEPTLNLALPVDDNETEQDHPKPQALPCDHMIPMTRNFHVGIIRRSPTPRLAGKYGPMILSMLPKGPVPPSAPSKKINDIKN